MTTGSPSERAHAPVGGCRDAADLGDQLVAWLKIAFEHLRRRAVGEARLDQDHLRSTVVELPHRLLVSEVAAPALAARPARAVGARRPRRPTLRAALAALA